MMHAKCHISTQCETTTAIQELQRLEMYNKDQMKVHASSQALCSRS